MALASPLVDPRPSGHRWKSGLKRELSLLVWREAPAGLALAEGIDAEPVPDREAGLEPSQEGKGGERLREGAWAPPEPEEPSLLPARRNGLMGGVRGREVTGGEGNHSQAALPWSGELGA